MSEEKERIVKLITEEILKNEADEDSDLDYAAEYKKQTGKDLETGKYITQ